MWTEANAAVAPSCLYADRGRPGKVKSSMAGEEGGRRTGPEGTWLWRWGTAGWLLLGVVGAVVILGLAYSKMRQVVIPLVIAVVAGILLEPAVSFMARHHVPRWLATLLSMVAIVTAVAGFATPTVYGIATQAGAMELLPKY